MTLHPSYFLYHKSGIKNTLSMVLWRFYNLIIFASTIIIKTTIMKSNAICPISTNKINENVARLNATFTVTLLAVFLFTSNIIPVVFLLVDFLLRGAELAKYSPLARLSGYILKALRVKSKPVNAGPKIFAARIGVLFSFLILLFALVELPVVAIVFATLFGVCAFLEAAFGFCVACQIYPFVYRFTYQSKIERIKL
jgi:hypothetical protein